MAWQSTTFSNRKLELDTFRKLRDLIYQKSGIFFTESKLYLLEHRLSHRLRELGLDDFEGYYQYLQSTFRQEEELRKLYNLITINETYFFRFEKQLEAFIKRILPSTMKVKEAKGLKKIRIWSAASSSGEELYSLAILLKEHLNSSLSSWSFELLGTDISQKILDAARQGIYGRNAFRGRVSETHLKKFFIPLGNGKYQIRDDLRKMVKFDYLNLNDIPRIRRLRGTDFIFCRNVLIYFTAEAKKKVVNAFYDILNHGGYLLLGEAESLHGVTSAFKVEHYPGAFVYRKE